LVSKLPHRLLWEWTRLSTFRRRRLITSTIAQPLQTQLVILLKIQLSMWLRITPRWLAECRKLEIQAFFASELGTNHYL